MGLDAVELIVQAEEHFGVQLTDEQTEKTETVGQFARLLSEVRSQTGVPLAYEVALLELRQIISKKFNIPLHEVLADSHFIRDLGLNQ